jgi:hypothetical protein
VVARVHGRPVRAGRRAALWGAGTTRWRERSQIDRGLDGKPPRRLDVFTVGMLRWGPSHPHSARTVTLFRIGACGLHLEFCADWAGMPEMTLALAPLIRLPLPTAEVDTSEVMQRFDGRTDDVAGVGLIM